MWKKHPLLGKTLKAPFVDFATPLVDRRVALENDEIAKRTVVQLYDEYEALRKYVYAIVPRPCTCERCRESEAMRQYYVRGDSSMFKCPPKEVMAKPIAKFADACERKRCVHMLEEDDSYLDALLRFNYFNWLRPPSTTTTPTINGAADANATANSNHHFEKHCVCDCLEMIRNLTPEQWIARTQYLGTVLNLVHIWEQMSPTEKESYGQHALFDVLKTIPSMSEVAQYGAEVGRAFYIIGMLLPDKEDSSTTHMHRCANRGCSNCEFADGDFRVCGFCEKDHLGVVHLYCSEECQREDWRKTHKEFHDLLG